MPARVVGESQRGEAVVKKIELDVSWNTRNETFESLMDEIVRETGADYRIVSEFGPAGGWPTVTFVVADEWLGTLIEILGYVDDLEFWRDQAETL